VFSCRAVIFAKCVSFSNYYQTKQNSPDTAEIHDEVVGFSNFSLDRELPENTDYDDSAVRIGNNRIFNDVMWCLEHC